MTLRRRTLLQAGSAATAAASLAGFAASTFAQTRTKLRVGYLHTPAVDGQIWLGQQSGAWAKRGLDLELIQFTTGLELFQAHAVDNAHRPGGGWEVNADVFKTDAHRRFSHVVQEMRSCQATSRRVAARSARSIASAMKPMQMMPT